MFSYGDSDPLSFELQWTMTIVDFLFVRNLIFCGQRFSYKAWSCVSGLFFLFSSFVVFDTGRKVSNTGKKKPYEWFSGNEVKKPLFRPMFQK